MPPTVASLVARDLIRAARDEHPSFDERRHPSPMLLRLLSAYQRRLGGKLIQRNPGILTASQDTALPLADFTAGITVPDFKRPLMVWALGTTGSGDPDPKTEVGLVSWQAAPRYYRAAYLRNTVLYLSGTPADWLGFTGIRFEYIPELDALTALTGSGGTLGLPNAAEPALVAYLAYRMAARGVKDPDLDPPDKVFFQREWLEAEDDLLTEVAGHVQAVSSVIRDVF
jgi:hypothetical protein